MFGLLVDHAFFTWSTWDNFWITWDYLDIIGLHNPAFLLPVAFEQLVLVPRPQTKEWAQIAELLIDPDKITLSLIHCIVNSIVLIIIWNWNWNCCSDDENQSYG